MDDAAPGHDALRRTLVVGGALLIASAVARLAWLIVVSRGVAVPLTALHWSSTLALSAALLVFAFGLRRSPSGSIVARRRLAVTAMVVLAAWPLVEGVVSSRLPFTPGTADFHRGIGYASIAVQLGASIVSVVAIARAGVIRGPLRWAPAWALASVAVPQLLIQVFGAASGPDLAASETDVIVTVMTLGQLAVVAAPLTLGVLSLMLASRSAAREHPAVEVFSSSRS